MNNQFPPPPDDSIPPEQQVPEAQKATMLQMLADMEESVMSGQVFRMVITTVGPGGQKIGYTTLGPWEAIGMIETGKVILTSQVMYGTAPKPQK